MNEYVKTFEAYKLNEATAPKVKFTSLFQSGKKGGSTYFAAQSKDGFYQVGSEAAIKKFVAKWKSEIAGLKGVEVYDHSVQHNISENLNEAAKFDVAYSDMSDMQDDEKGSKSAANKWIYKTAPLKVESVEGEVDDNTSEVDIVLTNGHKISFTYNHSGGNSMLVISDKQGARIFEKTGDKIESYIGSTGSVVGDILLMYSNWRDKKLK